ncbi:hypothetical protein GCM10023321_25840 [Pseudonocardia eucalypti]|uniref:Uncharacterized protein n=1 Tax=Pseudonocardia eucalypti TaxID=648755 RepID=A0ABP9PZ55_9PSEU|nr:hypothetical protein [Pseudonocardia eucalypti]
MTRPERVVYAVHAVRPQEISAITLISFNLKKAEEYAATLSTDPGVLAGAVTRLVVDALGHRTAVALYVAGVRQEVPWISNDRRIAANGHGQASKYSPH